MTEAASSHPTVSSVMPLTVRLRQSSLAGRVRMAAALPRLTRRRDRPSRAIARALRTTALGRDTPDERAWTARIEDRGRVLGSGAPTTSPPGGLWATLISVTPVLGRLLMRLIRELQPRSCLELGTGLGISTFYQAASLQLSGAGTLTTLEGRPKNAAIAEQGLSELGLSERVQVRVGPISATLEDVLERTAPVDFAFFDAEHTEEATLEHFHATLPYLARGAVVIFDDIRTNDEMKRAWRAIEQHERVSLAVGLGRLGITVIDRG